MSDDFDRLKNLMASATPDPDPTAKAENLRLAEENFARLQDSADQTRLTSNRPSFWAGLFEGVIAMLTRMTSRAALTATTSIVAVGLGIFVLLPKDGGFDLTLPPLTLTEAVDAPIIADISRPLPAELARRDIRREEAEADLAAKVDQRLSVASANAPAPQAIITGGLASSELSVGTLGYADTTQARVRVRSDDQMAAPAPNTENFANEAANPVHRVLDDPVSTFSADVDTASYAVVRSSLMQGYLPDPDSVRIEEMLNYFPYDYPVPEAGTAPFHPTVTVMPTPWNADTQLLHIAIQGMTPALEDRPPLNLVFLIDTSGSMNSPNKLPLLKQSFRLMLNQLRPEDQVAIVTYAGSAGRVLDPTPAAEQSTILAALNRLGAGGSTAGQAGLQQAYATAAEMADDGEISRVILATDGDFNVGLSNPDELKDYIAKKRDSGIYLSVLGFGRGNLQDATMQALAQNGNGQAAFIDTLSEAQKVLVDQLSGALFPIADDVKLQVEFNPATVAEYRLIGYETRALAQEDFNNDAVDAGEIGAGYAMTALYEITAPGSSALLIDPSRYQPAADITDRSDELGFLKIRYKSPGDSRSQLIEIPITPHMGQANDDTRFAAAIAGFGQLLRDSTYIGTWGFGDAITLANQAKGDDTFGYRAEAITLMRLAQSLSEN